jgi:hypothetical protein
VVGAANIAARGGGTIDDVPDESSTTHRRAGTVPTRRDRRRHRWDTSRAARRSSPTPGRPTATEGSRSKGVIPVQHHLRARDGHAATTAPFEDRRGQYEDQHDGVLGPVSLVCGSLAWRLMATSAGRAKRTGQAAARGARGS